MLIVKYIKYIFWNWFYLIDILLQWKFRILLNIFFNVIFIFKFLNVTANHWEFIIYLFYFLNKCFILFWDTDIVLLFWDTDIVLLFWDFSLFNYIILFYFHNIVQLIDLFNYWYIFGYVFRFLCNNILRFSIFNIFWVLLWHLIQN